MEVKSVQREKMLCEMIAERDELILGLHAELTMFRVRAAETANAGKPPLSLVPSSPAAPENTGDVKP